MHVLMLYLAGIGAGALIGLAVAGAWFWAWFSTLKPAEAQNTDGMGFAEPAPPPLPPLTDSTLADLGRQ